MRSISANRFSNFLPALTCLLALFPFTPICLGAQAAETADQERNAQLTSQLRNAKLVNASYQLQAVVSNEEILITTQKKPKASPDELKIQSVLLSKIAFETITSGPKRIKLRFLDFDSGTYSEVSVKRADVILFGEGKLSKKDLLASLEITSSQSEADSSVQSLAAPGPLQTDRIMAINRINRMKAGGTNVSSFMKLFDAVEEAAKKEDQTQVTSLLIDLNRRLKDQEELLRGLAQRSRQSLQSTATPVSSQPQRLNLKNAGPGEHGPNMAARLFNMVAETKISTYPNDMKETASRVLGELKFMAEHDGHATAGYNKLEEVGNLMDTGRVDDARALLNQTARETDPAFKLQYDRR